MQIGVISLYQVLAYLIDFIPPNQANCLFKNKSLFPKIKPPFFPKILFNFKRPIDCNCLIINI